MVCSSTAGSGEACLLLSFDSKPAPDLVTAVSVLQALLYQRTRAGLLLAGPAGARQVAKK
jgi:hypothetical protein